MSGEVEIKKIDLSHLKPSEREALTPFTLEEFTPLLRGLPLTQVPGTVPFGFAALQGSDYAGLLLGSYQPQLMKAKIYTLFVAESARNQKIGAQLLEAAESLVRENGCVVIEKKYPENSPYSNALKKLFCSQGWEKPERLLTQYWFDVTFSPSWLKTAPQLPPDFRTFNWKQLKIKEKEEILRQKKQRRFPAHVSPLNHPEQIDYRTSLGLRHKGEVIGWAISHRISPDTTRFSALYLAPEYRSKPYGIRLLAEACLKHVDNMRSIPYTLFELSEESDEPLWDRFVTKKLAPHAIKIVPYSISWKDLK